MGSGMWGGALGSFGCRGWERLMFIYSYFRFVVGLRLVIRRVKRRRHGRSRSSSIETTCLDTVTVVHSYHDYLIPSHLICLDQIRNRNPFPSPACVNTFIHILIRITVVSVSVCVSTVDREEKREGEK